MYRELALIKHITQVDLCNTTLLLLLLLFQAADLVV